MTPYNALGAVQAFRAGKQDREYDEQIKARKGMGNALAMGDFGGARDMAFRAGDIGTGLQIGGIADQRSQAQTQAQQVRLNEQQQRQVLGGYYFSKSLLEMDEASRARYLSDPSNLQALQSQLGVEVPQGQIPTTEDLEDDLRTFQMIAQAQGIDLGGGGEAFTLSPGSRRFGPDGQMIAEAPFKPAEQQFETTTVMQGGRPVEVQYDPRDPEGTMQVIGDAVPPRSLVNVNTGDEVDPRPQIGTVPPGYQAVFDDAEGTYRLETVPGGPAAREEEALTGKLMGAIAADNEQFGAIMTNIDEASELISGFSAGMGSLLDAIPATQARNLKARLETVRANIGFDKLNEMRQTSPTGGALGQVTERELAFLQSVRGSLDTGQSPEQLRQTLMEIKESLERLREARELHYRYQLDQRRGQSRPQIAPTEPLGAPGETLRFNPVTGDFE